jgi:hypothetical protein
VDGCSWRIYESIASKRDAGALAGLISENPRHDIGLNQYLRRALEFDLDLEEFGMRQSYF